MVLGARTRYATRFALFRVQIFRGSPLDHETTKILPLEKYPLYGSCGNRGIYMTMTREEKACLKWCEEKEEAGNTAKICVAHQRACIYTQILLLNIRSPYSCHCLENHK